MARKNLENKHIRKPPKKEKVGIPKELISIKLINLTWDKVEYNYYVLYI